MPSRAPAPPLCRTTSSIGSRKVSTAELGATSPTMSRSAFVVVVETTRGKYRRCCFLTAASAERSATNALAKGYDAKVYLAELKPLWRLEGGVSS